MSLPGWLDRVVPFHGWNAENAPCKTISLVHGDRMVLMGKCKAEAVEECGGCVQAVRGSHAGRTPPTNLHRSFPPCLPISMLSPPPPPLLLCLAHTSLSSPSSSAIPTIYNKYAVRLPLLCLAHTSSSSSSSSSPSSSAIPTIYNKYAVRLPLLHCPLSSRPLHSFAPSGESFSRVLQSSYTPALISPCGPCLYLAGQLFS